MKKGLAHSCITSNKRCIGLYGFIKLFEMTLAVHIHDSNNGMVLI